MMFQISISEMMRLSYQLWLETSRMLREDRTLKVMREKAKDTMERKGVREKKRQSYCRAKGILAMSWKGVVHAPQLLLQY